MGSAPNWIEQQFSPSSYSNLDLFKQSLSFLDIGKLAEMYNQQSQLNLINTYVSDYLFKWPHGKSPWSQEQGGCDMAPPNAREAYLCFKVRLCFRNLFSGTCFVSDLALEAEQRQFPRSFLLADLTLKTVVLKLRCLVCCLVGSWTLRPLFLKYEFTIFKLYINAHRKIWSD
jgi:hypothetical protein